MQFNPLLTKKAEKNIFNQKNRKHLIKSDNIIILSSHLLQIKNSVKLF